MRDLIKAFRDLFSVHLTTGEVPGAIGGETLMGSDLPIEVGLVLPDCRLGMNVFAQSLVDDAAESLEICRSQRALDILISVASNRCDGQIQYLNNPMVKPLNFSRFQPTNGPIVFETVVV